MLEYRSPYLGWDTINAAQSLFGSNQATVVSASDAKIPQTSADRLTRDAPSLTESDTILYLAYGSNLSTETFLGRRGIRPLSQVNVSVPTLELSFDLPGFPYVEPCFANVTFRKLPEKPKLPAPPAPPEQPFSDSSFPPGKWNSGLIGVVYEVTKEDYQEIIRTEGGGSGYKEIVIPCVPVASRASRPERPPFPDIPKPFLARTLYAPYLPLDDPDEIPKGHWWRKWLLRPSRPDPNYAQASARYLKLITDGAREHDLPEDYQRYLQSLQPYTVTSTRQRIAQAIMSKIAILLLSILLLVGNLVAKDGNFPPMFVAFINISLNLVWSSYDWILKSIFGNGERTQEEETESSISLPADSEKGEWRRGQGGWP